MKNQSIKLLLFLVSSKALISAVNVLMSITL